jgi:hypothetical protein
MTSFAKKVNLEGWDDDLVIKEGGTWNYNEDGEGLEMSGIVNPDGSLEVKDVQNSGEGSGTVSQLLVALFEEFKGDLVASRIWEGGDTIDKITIKKGKVTEKAIDL